MKIRGRPFVFSDGCAGLSPANRPLRAASRWTKRQAGAQRLGQISGGGLRFGRAGVDEGAQKGRPCKRKKNSIRSNII
jgi:hypothetical protein